MIGQVSMFDIAERWADVAGSHGKYQVSDKGNIRSVRRKVWNGKGYYSLKPRILRQGMSRNGYKTIRTKECGISQQVHRLVAIAFIENTLNKPQVNHINGDKTDNRVKNLEWCTQQYNLNYLNGQYKRAESRDYIKISKLRSEKQSKEVVQYEYDGTVVAIYKNAYIAEQLGFNRTTINQCCLGNKKSYKGYLWRYGDYIKKQIPKKPTEDECDRMCCPSCSWIVDDFWGGDRRYIPHCENCGQALDWSEKR